MRLTSLLRWNKSNQGCSKIRAPLAGKAVSGRLVAGRDANSSNPGHC